MPEMEREEVLAQRQEELQRIQDKRNLDQMFKAMKEGGVDDDSVSKAAKRTHFLIWVFRNDAVSLVLISQVRMLFVVRQRKRVGSSTS